MIKDYSINFTFKNNVLRFESHVSEFTSKIYDEYDLKSEKIDLNSKIEDLFNGKKVNSTENSAALHPKYRKEPSYVHKNSKYFELLNSANNIVSIGIGGSYEGTKLLIESLGNTKGNHIFITGSDPQEFLEKIHHLKSKETVFIVSSKSFKTEETIENLKSAISWSGDLERFIAITANKAEALKYKIKNIIEFDKEIGGRYSIWSNISIAADWEQNNESKKQFVLGGRQADIDIEKDADYLKFLKILSFSDIWLHNHKNKNSRVVLSYIWKYRSFPNYIQQLEMESLGKKYSKKSEFKRTGQIIFGGYGPTAQHSYFQLMHQGTQEICADIIVSKKNPNSMAYAQGVTQSKLLSNGAEDFLNSEERINGNVPLNLFTLYKEDSFTLGYLIATWEHRTYITAIMLGINAFDQFGVNAGKIYTKKFLENRN